jgi:hypothetical protein
MARSNLNTQAKRKRELAKKDKRAAKDEKRAQKKAEARVARGTVDGAAQPPAQPSAASLSAAAVLRRLQRTS